MAGPVGFLLRVLHRVAMRLRRRGRPPGAAVAVLNGGHVLVVRHSYRPGLDLPGGAPRAGESAEQAAARELAEETGLRVDPAALRPAYTTLWLRIFEWRCPEDPVPRPDGLEVVEARFVDPDEVDRAQAGNALREWLRCRIPPGTPRRRPS